MSGRSIIRDLQSNKSNYAINRTIYVNNLDDRIPISKQKIALEKVFSKYGKIESIKAFNSYFRRGQAWITFSNTDSAVAAMKGEGGTQIFEKHINVSFAAKESECNSIAACKSSSNSPMIPRSISARIDLYKQYLVQWYKNAENSGFLNSLDDPDKSKAEILNNQVLYDVKFVNAMRSNEYRGLCSLPNIYHDNITNPLKRKSELQIDDLLMNGYNKFSSSAGQPEISNTAFVQIETGSCKEEELYTLFSHMNGFKELRFIPVSFKCLLIV